MDLLEEPSQQLELVKAAKMLAWAIRKLPPLDQRNPVQFPRTGMPGENPK